MAYDIPPKKVVSLEFLAKVKLLYQIDFLFSTTLTKAKKITQRKKTTIRRNMVKWSNGQHREKCKLDIVKEEALRTLTCTCDAIEQTSVEIIIKEETLSNNCLCFVHANPGSLRVSNKISINYPIPNSIKLISQYKVK